MTIAVCFKCGGTKFGALTDCYYCGEIAGNAKDLAISILLSDHYFPIKELEEIGVEIAINGRLPIFAEQRQTEMIATIENNPYFNMLLGQPAPTPPYLSIHPEMRLNRFRKATKILSSLFEKKR